MAKGSGRATPAYVLHSHDWSESSLILDLFTREQGRVVAVAKGAKRPYSQLRPVLLSFQRIQVQLSAGKTAEAEVMLLRHAEWAGGPAWPGGAAMLPGFYINELLMRLLVRHDPQPLLFDAYAQTLIAMNDAALLQAALRAFELVLLRQLGHLPDLSMLTIGQAQLEGDTWYDISPELGVSESVWRPDARSNATSLPGEGLLAIEAALGALRQPDRGQAPSTLIPELMRACLPILSELKAACRQLLHYHLGSQTLRTRQLMMELHQS